MIEIDDPCADQLAPVDRARSGYSASLLRRGRISLLWIVLFFVLAPGVLPVAAQEQNIRHFGENRLRFAAVEPFLSPDATGTGIVDYKGGKEPSSQWRASFRYSGLEPGASYTVVVRGRFGAAGSPESTAYTPLCSFTADEQGQGGCFWYFRGLARLAIVQLRAGDERGTQVLEARRARGPGSIQTTPNRFSPGGEMQSRHR